MTIAVRFLGTLLSAVTITACLATPAASPPTEGRLADADPSATSNSMVVALFGASGNIGGDIAREALARGHRVIGISRNPDRMNFDDPLFSPAKGDVTDPASFRELIRDADAVVISVSGNIGGNAPEQSTSAIAARVAIDALSAMDDAPYLLQLGGATTLYEGPEEMLENLPFPVDEGSALWGMLFGHWIALETYRDSDIAWTVLTPPLMIQSDLPRTGDYRSATTGPIYDDTGSSHISRRDLAVAAVDELERRQFSGMRFTVGY